MEAILAFDAAIFQFVRDYIWNPVLDVIMPLITHLGDGGIFWILLTVLLLCFKKTRKYGVVSGLSLILSLLVVNLCIKPLVDRPRPYALWPDVIVPLLSKLPGDASFPSGHASASFAPAVAICCENRKLGIPLVILALFIALSRIYVQVHYPTDVIAGIVIGALCGVAAYFIVKKVEPAICKKWRTSHPNKEQAEQSQQEA